jgi:hypothetical protein
MMSKRETDKEFKNKKTAMMTQTKQKQPNSQRSASSLFAIKTDLSENESIDDNEPPEKHQSRIVSVDTAKSIV